MTNNPPARFRHRTAEVEAVQWTGTNADQLRAFCGPDFDEIDPEDRTENPDASAAVRESKHGTWRGLEPGYWVVKIGEEFYEESATDFAAQFEPAVVSPPPGTNQTLREQVAEALALRANGPASDGRGWYRDEEQRQELLSGADTVLAVLRGLTLRELELLYRPNTPPSRPEPRLPNHIVNEEEAPAPVKQRADCTELEWAEQERARFERLYTREFTRAEQAEDLLKVAHETSNRSEAERARAVQRAEAMERAMESTAADALKHRGCHRDLMAQCLRAERAEAEAERLRTDRAVVLREAADGFDRHAEQLLNGVGDKAVFVAKALQEQAAVWREAAETLRRMADEAQQQPDTETRDAEAHPPTHAWKVESPRRDKWASWGATYDERVWAAASYEDVIAVAPQRPFRLVRATTTYAVEAEHQPPAGATDDAPPVEPHPTEADLTAALAILDRFYGRDASEPTAQPGPGGVADEEQPTAEVIHGCPPDGSGLTPCCGRTPFELPLTDRISSEAPVTCPGAEK